MSFRRIVSHVLPVLVLVAVLAVASSAFAVSSTLSLKVSANGQVFDVPASLVSFDATTGVASTVDTSGVTAWIGAVNASPKVNHKVVNWKTLNPAKNAKKLTFTHNDGFQLDQSAAVTALCGKLWTETTSTPTATLVLTSTKLAAAKKLGKQIFVIQSIHTFYVYDNDKIIRTYRCAVGMKAYPSPNGNFHIGKKVKNPTWVNGYAPWSMNMPAKISGGPNSPLGTRALYVYSGTVNGKGSDLGVRFHGVPKDEDSSIGHSLSHGCFRMHRKDVEALYPIIPVGTVVYVRAS